MNLFYENYPETISVNGTEIPIVTDFREYIKLLDMLKDDSLKSSEKVFFLNQYFLEEPDDFPKAISELTDFVTMEDMIEEEYDDTDAKEVESRKELYSFEYDYPFIFSAFLSEYRINLRTIPYMHWWEFKILFDALSDKTEIKQRIMYRGYDLNAIKNKEERERIRKIQQAIRLPKSRVSDYDIGNAFEW